jgi:CRP-like cAMP-binding protein
VSRGEAVLTTFGSGEHFGEMALIRSVPRSATIHAEGACELIVIRRGDFFEILRKEHELAVKLLWQFLGVLADRLDQTSKDLRVARAELTAEDVTAEIFPDLAEEEEERTDPYGVRHRASGGGPPGSATP